MVLQQPFASPPLSSVYLQRPAITTPQWLEGAKNVYNTTIEYIGIQNEGNVPSADCVTDLRQVLNAAGFNETLIVIPDTHDFSFLPSLANQSTQYFRDVGVIGIHEPLRSSMSVPEAASATGKPIWSSEAYTTYSDSNGGGCWARALNWGYLFGNVTAHIAWNLIQAYPSYGAGMNCACSFRMLAMKKWRMALAVSNQ